MALSDFRNGYTSVSLYSDVLYADIRQHKKLLCQQKKIFRIEINVAQQNYVSRKKICRATKKLCGTQKKNHVD